MDLPCHPVYLSRLIPLGRGVNYFMTDFFTTFPFFSACHVGDFSCLFISAESVCMYRRRPSWRCPWDRAFYLDQGEGPIVLMGPISQPAVPLIPHHSRWIVLTLDRTHAFNMRFLSQLYFRQLRVSRILFFQSC